MFTKAEEMMVSLMDGQTLFLSPWLVLRSSMLSRRESVVGLVPSNAVTPGKGLLGGTHLCLSIHLYCASPSSCCLDWEGKRGTEKKRKYGG